MPPDLTTPVVLRLEGITKRFGPQLANDDISFALHEGEVIALLGENGAGKTTLMNILFGHYTADEGSVEVMGRPLPPGQPRAALAAGVGMVHQHFTLADNLTVAENIVLGTRPLWRAGLGDARARIRDLAHRFGNGLAFVFRHLPLPDIRLHAEKAAEAAAAQGRFWEMHDQFVAHTDPLRAAELQRVRRRIRAWPRRLHQRLPPCQ